MKALLIVCACLAIGATKPTEAADRSAQWEKVDEAIRAALPKSAITALEPIISGATRDKSYPEAVKALALKVVFEGRIQGNKPEERIHRLQVVMPKQPAEMQRMLEAVLAHWYLEFFHANRWRFMQRTQMAVVDDDDPLTWDLARILAEIDSHFQLALTDRAALQSTPIAAWDDLLVEGTVPDAYCPTLFDFIAYEALGFYAAGEQAGLHPEDAFVLTADGPIFAPVDEFVRWEPDTGDENSPTLAAVRLYQELLAFHRTDPDRSAFLAANLERLRFGHNAVAGENKNEAYIAALRRFVDSCADHEISAQGLAEWAAVLYRAGDYLEAREVAQRGLAFENSPGGAMCFNTIQRIEAGSASIYTDLVWNEPSPSIHVSYRNVTKVYFRAVKYDFETEVAPWQRHVSQVDETRRREILERAPALEWTAELPETPDYKERIETLPAPLTLERGFYFIVCSLDASFGETDNVIRVSPVWVSDLALVVRQNTYEGVVDGLVLRARSGAPVRGARVRAWDREFQDWRDGVVRTDRNGHFRVRSLGYGQLKLLVEHGGDRISTLGTVGAQHVEEPGAVERTIFFTDRALYRPGQTVHYKGVRIRYDESRNEYRTLDRGKILVVFSDSNQREIARTTHELNDYGSFAGTFTAPRTGLMGRMRISDPTGTTWIHVEEYKRPKFRVSLDAPDRAARLGDEVNMGGHASSYAGAGVGDARIRWRVMRRVRFPVWCWWGRYRPTGSRAIAHGTTRTKPDGTFEIRFVARPSPDVPETDEPTFEYEVYVDVTDPSGETRSARRVVRVGYTALQATVTANPWQTQDAPVDLNVTTRSLDGKPQGARGTLEVYRLEQPQRVTRGKAERSFQRKTWLRSGEPGYDPTDPRTWDTTERVSTNSFGTGDDGQAQVSVQLDAGVYRVILETRDRFGTSVKAQHDLHVLNPTAGRFPVKIPSYFVAKSWTVQPGDRFVGLWGTGYDRGRACVEVTHRGRTLQRYWTHARRTQASIEYPVDETLLGGFTVRVTYVRENRAYIEERVVDVPWMNKKLDVTWESMRSELVPGQEETWTVSVRGADARAAVAEMVATLYDASLDQYRGHSWPSRLASFERERRPRGSMFTNALVQFGHLAGHRPVAQRPVDLRYRRLPAQIVAASDRRRGFGAPFALSQGIMVYGNAELAVRSGRSGEFVALDSRAVAMPPPAAAPPPMDSAEAVALPGDVGVVNMAPQGPDLSAVSARRNLSETAFFFPRLRSDSTGVVKMEFTMPEALTEWKFMGFAHDRELRGGLLTDRVVTSKDLMVQPNPPRFVREGDVIEFTAKVTNQSDRAQRGRVRLTLSNARTLESMDAALGNTATELDFDVPAKESRTYSWRLSVPDGCEFLTYKAVGATAEMSDGEEGYLPVLSRRILATESLPLPIRGKQTRRFEFTSLLDSETSTTLRHQSLTVQMVSQPAWYAIMALPYLMEYPYACSEQVFNRYYANALARHIVTSDPKIGRVFDQWRGTEVLDSPLEKNEDLKAVMLEETPWLRQAKSESQARRNVGFFFDTNRIEAELRRAIHQLQEMRTADGLWPWFPGGRPNHYISLYITTGFGRLRHFGVRMDRSLVSSLSGLDAWVDQKYRRIQRQDDPDANHIDPMLALYLYGRSFFLTDQPIADSHRQAVDYWLEQARTYWTDLPSRQSQAHIALALHRLGEKDVPHAIMKSIAEHAVHDPELGMFWRDREASWWWHRAPIETQALLIEAFDEVANDSVAVAECAVWLLKQKQVQNWKTTKATADAVYALLLRGTDALASDVLVEVALADEPIRPERPEAGTGFYEQRFARAEISADMGRISVTKRDAGVSWGSIHWQYLEDIGKVQAYRGTPLTLKKSLFVRETTKKGPVLRPADGPLEVGDEVVVRIELRTDRDMEFVHLKDQRGSGTEPVNVLSQYKYQDGLMYYESTRDTATHFFIDHLSKGTYIFEYATRAQHRGRYQSGVASIQCMYAPEFNSHSESVELQVR